VIRNRQREQRLLEHRRLDEQQKQAEREQQETLAVNARREYAQQKMNERIRELYRAQQMQVKKDQVYREEQTRLLKQRREQENEERLRRLDQRRQLQQSIMRKKQEDELQHQQEMEKEKAIRTQMSKLALEEWHRNKREQHKKKGPLATKTAFNRNSSNKSVNPEPRGTPRSDASKRVLEEIVTSPDGLILQNKAAALGAKYQTVYQTPSSFGAIESKAPDLAARKKYNHLNQEHIKRKMA
jgi:hypothetical protein